jgi:hypothetical protein
LVRTSRFNSHCSRELIVARGDQRDVDTGALRSTAPPLWQHDCAQPITLQTACRSVRSSDRNPFDFEPIAALEAGDVLHFNCHVDTTEERAAELGVDAPPTTLRFGNQAFDAEMCLLNGHTTGARLGFGF